MLSLLAAILVAVPKVSTWPSDREITCSGNDSETTSVAIAPGEKPNCPYGRLIVSSGTRPGKITTDPTWFGGTSAASHTCQLLITGLEPEATTKVVELPVPGNGAILPGQDSVLTKAANGDILFVYLCAVNDPVTSPAAKSIVDLWSSYNGGWRTAFVLWRSTDGGDTWKTSAPGGFSSSKAILSGPKSPMIILDTALYSGISQSTGQPVLGAYAWPQTDWFGGYDREEIYCDPWHPSVIYISCGVRAGTATVTTGTETKPLYSGKEIFQNVLFESSDGGTTWGPPLQLDNVFNPPTQITSVPPTAAHPNGRVYLIGYGAYGPLLRWTDDFGKTLSGGVTCRFEGTSPNNPDSYFDEVEAAALPLSSFKLGQFSMARGMSNDQLDTIRVAYTGTKAGHQIAIVVNVIVRADGSTKVEKALTLMPDDALQGHILFPHFIESNQCGSMKGSINNCTVLAWLEASHSASEKKFSGVRPKITKPGENQASKVGKPPLEPYGDISAMKMKVGDGTSLADRTADQVSAAAAFIGQASEHSIGEVTAVDPISATNKERRNWNPGGAFFGDYVKGAFFSGMKDHSLNFVIQYPGKRTGAFQQRVNYNIVRYGNLISIGGKGIGQSR